MMLINATLTLTIVFPHFLCPSNYWKAFSFSLSGGLVPWPSDQGSALDPAGGSAARPPVHPFASVEIKSWLRPWVLLSRKVRWRQNIGRVLRRRFFLTSWHVTYLTLTQCWPLTEWLVVLRRCWRGATVEVWRPSGRRWWLVLVMRVWVEGRQLDDVDRLWWLSRRVDRRVTQSSWNCQQQTSRVVYDEHHTTTVHTQSQLDATPYSYSAYITDTFAISTCMLNHCLDWYKCQRTYTTPDSGSTHLLHDLSPDGGIYPTILFCKLLTVTRETINWP